MSVFFISDNHYNHLNIIKYSQRPFTDADDMNSKMIAAHNAIVDYNDTVYFLGDLAFYREPAKIKALLNRLHGNKHLILGNHDKTIRNNPRDFIGDRLFQTIQDYKTITVEGQFIVMFHYGCRVWEKAHHGAWLLYGHSHGSLPPHGKSVDVGVDAKFVLGTAPYRPLEFSEIKSFMDKQSFQSVDHHGEKDDE